LNFTVTLQGLDEGWRVNKHSSLACGDIQTFLIFRP